MKAEKIRQEHLEESRQYLTFILAGEEYAIDILKVQEIRGVESTTKIPNTPDYLLGVINLRGSVVPIVDLRFKFNLVDAAERDNAVIILVKILAEGGDKVVGMLVDAVSDVYDINLEDISDTPALASNMVKHFVTGLATVDDKMIIMLDIDSLITSDGLDSGLEDDSLDYDLPNKFEEE